MSQEVIFPKKQKQNPHIQKKEANLYALEDPLNSEFHMYQSFKATIRLRATPQR